MVVKLVALMVVVLVEHLAVKRAELLVVKMVD